MESMEPMQSTQPKKFKISKKIVAIILAVVVFIVAVVSIFLAVASKNKNKELKCDCEYCSQMFEYYNYLITSGQIELKEVEGYNPYLDEFMSGNQHQDNQQDSLPSNSMNPGNQQTDNQHIENQQTDNQYADNQQITQPNNQQLNEPSQWSKAQVVEVYKHAAGKTHNSVTSYQKMTMRQMTAPGINQTLVNFAANIMDRALSNNSKDIAGITGGHQNLTVSDVQTAKAYRSGNNIIIEMTMKEQVDGGKANMYSGSVGHAISVVGDIDSVIGQFSGLGMDAIIADNDVKIHYANPKLRVTINSDGKIINGTWSYVTNISLTNLTIKALGITVPVEQATSVVDFVVTLNGGFKG